MSTSAELRSLGRVVPASAQLQVVHDVGPEPAVSSNRASRVRCIHSFRAIAIISIVAGHCIGLFDWYGHNSQGLVSSLMLNGTIFFVFIAGFLFQHLSGKFVYRDYIKKKLLYVLLPYVVLSLPVLMVQWQTQSGSFDPAFPHHLSGTLAGNVIWSLLTGWRTILPYWFIPMIAVFYFLAPVLLWLDRGRFFYRLLALLLAVPVFVHRPRILDHVWQSCAYFLPVYFYGMWFSRNRERAMAWHARWLPALLTLIAALTWLEVVYLERPQYIISDAMFSTEQGTVDINAIQKLLLCGVLLVILQRFGDVLDRRLAYLGDVSFGVFFVHVFFIQGYLYLTDGILPEASLWGYGLAIAVTLALSVGCLSLARLLLGRYSRSVVGC